MPAPVNLAEASVEQVKKFFDSFDIVLSDCDGVIWYLGKPIPGAMTAANTLQALGKKLYLVTNNSTVSMDRYVEKLRINGLHVKAEQIINTWKATSWYLKKIKFSDEAFVVATASYRQALIDGGIKLAPNDPKPVEEDPIATLRALYQPSSVKAVIIDFAPTFDWMKLAFAIICLNSGKDVLYMCGPQDEWVPCGDNRKVIGPGPMINIISKYTGRVPIECAKPSNVMRDYVLETCNVKDPKRCLFIGDTIEYDMKFGSLCGFQKLLVGTGIDNLSGVEQNEETCPDYYIPSLGLLHPLIDLLHNSTNANADH